LTGRRIRTLYPGAVLYLMHQNGMSADDINTLLYERSDLLGVSGISSDKSVSEASTAPEAKEAINLFCIRAAGELASLVASRGGLMLLLSGLESVKAQRGYAAVSAILWAGWARRSICPPTAGTPSGSARSDLI
jgi:acetate kinase